MPSYRWLFKGDPDRPTEDARDLVAYLNVLGRPAMESSPSTPSATTPAPLTGLIQNQQMSSDLEEGKAIFLANCAGCHGTDGTGHSPGGRALRPVAFNLAGFHIPPAIVWNALQHGVPGTSMPAWNELPGSRVQSGRRLRAFTG